MSKSTARGSGVTRRSFVGASAAAMAALALVGCQSENQLEETGDAASVTFVDAELDPNTQGKWVPAVCNINCGGMCANRAYVVDGVVVRQKTDDTGLDSQASPQLRACARGRSRRQDTFGADRLKYPMKRKGWEPHTGGKKELRGIDEWVRISWDEALEIVADELKNAIGQYGNRSILLGGWTQGSAHFMPIMNTLGGAVSVTGTLSWGTTTFNSTAMGLPFIGLGEENDRTDWKNADYMVIYGGNPAWASPGTYTYYFNEAKKAGAQFVYVGPDYNATAAHFDAKWMRVRPGTDTAFLLAVAYEMFKMDEAAPGSVIDWDFLEKYTVGINGEMMPADAKVGENFYDYLMGSYDGQAKDAEWASVICGTPAEDIRWYADMMQRKNAVTTLRSYAAFRTNDSDNLSALYMTIGFMGGHIGKPGHTTGVCYHACVGSCVDDIFVMGLNGAPAFANPVDDIVLDCDQWTAVLDGTYNRTGDILFGGLGPREPRELDIHVIAFIESSGVNTFLDVNSAVKALRKVDFVFSTARAYTSQARYSDVVLPITSQWEEVGSIKGGANASLVNREGLAVGVKVCEPLFEAKTEHQIMYELAAKCGLNADELFPLSEAQEFYNILAGTQMKTPEGELKPFLSITQEDIDAMGVEGAVQEGIVPMSEFLGTGVYRVERSEGDGYTYYGYKAYLDDPEGNPRLTPSGKFEIYCQTKADALNAAGWTKDYTWKPYPTYKAPVNGYEASFEDFEAGVKGEYPYQIFNPHYMRRSHTQFDNLPWLRHAFPNPFYVSAVDAAEKGVKDGDVVRIWSRVGQMIRPVSVTERLMPGVVALPHGAWIDIDEETGIEKAGAENVLCEAVTSGAGVSGYNTNLVNFEKYDGELEADYLLPQRIIEFQE